MAKCMSGEYVPGEAESNETLTACSRDDSPSTVSTRFLLRVFRQPAVMRCREHKGNQARERFVPCHRREDLLGCRKGTLDASGLQPGLFSTPRLYPVSSSHLS